MKKVIIAVMISFFGIANAQETTKELVTKEVIRVLDSINKSKLVKETVAIEATSQEGSDEGTVAQTTTRIISKDSLKETVEEHSMKFEGLTEQLSGMQGILDKLSKIKVSGYIQAQYENYDIWNTGVHGLATENIPTTNSFSLRKIGRAHV